MHAAIPHFRNEIKRVMQIGGMSSNASGLVNQMNGKLLAEGIAVALKLGFGYIMMRDNINRGRDFFEENFVMNDPLSQNGKRYYQGKFLLRTKKVDDDMNVYFCFCPKPQELLIGDGVLNPDAVIDVKTMDEAQADKLEKDPDKVDLVLRFKDAETIKDLLGSGGSVDVASLMIENLVQISGNSGHIFKLGAIAKNVELSL